MRKLQNYKIYIRLIVGAGSHLLARTETESVNNDVRRSRNNRRGRELDGHDTQPAGRWQIRSPAGPLRPHQCTARC